MPDLRRYARAPFDRDLSFTTTAHGQRFGRARDISLGGMFILTPHAPPFGTELVIRFTTPNDGTELELRAVVRWNGDGGMGVQFGALGAVETHHITNLTRPAP